MEYKLDNPNKPTALISWLRLFKGLSVSQFADVYDLLEFPVMPTDDIRQIAHAFVLTIANLLHWENTYQDYGRVQKDSFWGTTSIDLLKGTSDDTHYYKKRLILFTNTFLHLEELGCADAIYAWGKTTNSYYKHTHRPRYNEADILSRWSIVLRHWAIKAWLNNPITTSNPENKWHIVIDNFFKKYSWDSKPPYQDDFPLSITFRDKLLSIILDAELKRFELETVINGIVASPKTLWEEFMFGIAIGHWLNQEGNCRIELSQWKAIFELLSINELNELDQWDKGNRILESNHPPMQPLATLVNFGK